MSYKEIPFGPWALAAVLVALPALVIPGRWAWSYVGLVLVYYIVFNADELGLLVGFVREQLPSGN